MEPIAVIEPAAPIREQLAGEGWSVFQTAEQFLETSQTDGALIAAPSDQHTELVRTFVAAGVPVLCEKPVGVRAADAAMAGDAAVASGTGLQVGYWRRFVPELRVLRERIALGELGDIYQLSCMQWDEQPPSPEFRLHSGGIIIDMGVHELDQARWLLGQEFTWLEAVPAGPGPGESFSASDPDGAVILARLSGGAAVNVSLGRRFPDADSCWVEVWGSAGYERIPFMWGKPGQQVFLDAMVAQAEAFGRFVRTGRPEGAGWGDAVAALTAAERATASLVQAAGSGAAEPAAAPQS
jgi:myo-inositol 2-dehydrogenase/D-chiro-inositol 1-dehydrogenase